MKGLGSDFYAWVKANTPLFVSLLSLGVALLGFLFTHSSRIRAALRRATIALGGKLGFTGSRYKASFLKTHRELRNIYLNRIEQLDVVATYVPLHVITAGGSRGNQPAIDVLLGPEDSRVVILGDPGSGKTTLLKSFGVSLVSKDVHRKQPEMKTRERGDKQRRDLVPIYVELRDFASRRQAHPTLADYISRHVLARHLPGLDGEAFFRNLLAQDRCVVLLDALDEVGTADYDAVRVAVHTFLDDSSERLPTARARVVMTSRIQNFLSQVDDWIPTGFLRYHVLAPFSDEDIQRFLRKRASELPPGKTPAALWEEIQGSSTLDLHRTPLVLNVSLGLYIHVPRYTIPESLATFYSEITQELLQRHDFRTRSHLTKRNFYPTEHKAQFLRELALKTALRGDRLAEFTYTELAAIFQEFRQRIAKLSSDDQDKLLAEVIDNAGLIRRVSDSGLYVFAHRSFHEYFAAVQLSKNAEQGVKMLIERADNPLWRQITIFFAAMDHEFHDALLTDLAEKNPELAGYSLAITSKVSPAVASLVVQRLDETVGKSNAVSLLGALSAICRNSGEEVRSSAFAVIGRVLAEVLSTDGATALWGLTHDDLLRLVRELSTTGVRSVVGTCVSLADLVGDDSRLVAPLWACLDYFASDPLAVEALQLVDRLLELAQTQEGFDALESCSPLLPPFVTPELRAAVYPLSNGLSRDSNLVTLLAWADHSAVLPKQQNGFLQAFARRNEIPSEWRRLQRELAKTPIKISTFPVGILLFWGGYWGALLLLVRNYLELGSAGFQQRHLVFWASSWQGWTALVVSSAALTLVAWLVASTVAGTQLSLEGVGGRNPANPILFRLDTSLLLVWLDGEGKPYWDSDGIVPFLASTLLQMPLLMAGAALAEPGHSFLRLAFGILLCFAVFWLPATRLFRRNTTLDLRTRSPLASAILADEGSQLWIRPQIKA